MDNTKLSFYEVKPVNGKSTLVSLDGKNSFPYGTKEEREETENLFKHVERKEK